MALKTKVMHKGHCARHTLTFYWLCVPNMEKIYPKLIAVERTGQVVRYLSSFIAKLQLNGPEGIGQG